MSEADLQSIPTIDLSSFEPGGNKGERAKAGQSLHDALHTLGFANIIGHGVSDALLQDAFSWSKKLFDLPHDEKMKAPHPASSLPHRGYSAPGIEKVYSRNDLERDAAKDGKGTSLRKIQDFKESYEIGSEDNPPQPNIWLPEETLPGYRSFTTKLYWELDKTAKRILEAVSLGLKLTEQEKDQFFGFHSGHNNQLRLLHYPPIEAEKLTQKVVGRMPPHQDWSSFTFVFQDDTGGLELEDPRNPGSFVAAKPMTGACVLNVGDMLQRFSNGIFPSAMHRVTLPPLEFQRESGGPERVTKARYSIPYFVAPDNDTIVQCLPSCVTADRSTNYEPVKFGDYGEYISKYMYTNNEQKDVGK